MRIFSLPILSTTCLNNEKVVVVVVLGLYVFFRNITVISKTTKEKGGTMIGLTGFASQTSTTLAIPLPEK